MKRILRNLRPLAPVIDVFLSWLTFIGIIWFRIIKFWGPRYTPFSKWLFFKMGMIPVVKHYYEPFPDLEKIEEDYKYPRNLVSLDFNVKSQLKFLDTFDFSDELSEIPFEANNSYYFNNDSFGIGDAEAYYSIIRLLKPINIIEIGGGFSTKLAKISLNKNYDENLNYKYRLICIEPYEYKSIDDPGIELIKSRVEECSIDIFYELDKNDILFIDSSHIIKPGGDVLYEIFEILPILKSGVFVHFHDIFSPNYYPKRWLLDEMRLWNEQFLLEGFLSYNKQFKIVLSMSYLMNSCRDKLNALFPNLRKYPDVNPSSFWIRKV